MKLYQRIALLVRAAENCRKSGNTEQEERHRETLAALVREHLPSGSGFDRGTTLDDATTPDRLEFHTEFHHLTEHGYYDGWTEHRVYVTPSLAFGIELHVDGEDRDGIHEYIVDTFHEALTADV